MINWKKIFLNEKKKTTDTSSVNLSRRDKIRIWKNIERELNKREEYKKKNGWN